MNLSSLRPYEVTDFGETTIHGDDQAKNEVLGSIEATEVLKIICGFGDVLAGELWTIDLRTLQSNKFSL